MKLSKFLFFALVFPFIISSCSKEGGESGLVGTWEATEFSYDGTSTATVSGQTIVTDFTGVGKDMELEMVFSEDPNEYTSGGSYTIELTYSAVGQSFMEDFTFDDFIGNGTWDLVGDQLTATDDMGNTSTSTVQIDGDQLTFDGELQRTTISQGATVIQDVNTLVVFERCRLYLQAAFCIVYWSCLIIVL